MRKIGLSLFTCMALMAFMGLSAQAFAVVDPDCDGDPYPNDFAVFGFAVDTPDSHAEHAVSSVTGSGVACGTEIDDGYVGVGTMNHNANIETPPGVDVYPTAGMAVGSYVGRTVVNVATFLGGTAVVAENVPASLTVDLPDSGPPGQDDCPVGVVACYKGVSVAVPGHNWNWVSESGGRYTLTIGHFYQDISGEPASLTNIHEFTLCARAGALGSDSCGKESGPVEAPVLQRNGDASFPIWLNRPTCYGGAWAGKGIYRATVINNAGQTTATAEACVAWHSPR